MLFSWKSRHFDIWPLSIFFSYSYSLSFPIYVSSGLYIYPKHENDRKLLGFISNVLLINCTKIQLVAILHYFNLIFQSLLTGLNDRNNRCQVMVKSYKWIQIKSQILWTIILFWNTYLPWSIEFDSISNKFDKICFLRIDIFIWNILIHEHSTTSVPWRTTIFFYIFVCSKWYILDSYIYETILKFLIRFPYSYLL